MADPRNADITALVHLIRALNQSKSHLMHQINSMKIKQSYFRSNNSWRILVELVQRIKILRDKYATTKRQITYSKHSASQNPCNNLLFDSIQADYHQISSLFTSIDQKVNESNKTSTTVKDLQAILIEKTQTLKTLNKKFKEKLSIQLKLDLKKSELNSKAEEMQGIREKISSFREKKKELELAKLKLTTNSFRSIKNAQIFNFLTSGHLNLYSKRILKKEMMKIYTSAQDEYEKYAHVLNLEKRKLQRLKFKNRSEFNEPRKNRVFESITTVSTDSWSQRLVSEETLRKPLAKPELMTTRNQDLFPYSLKLEDFEDFIGINDMKSLTNSLREANQKLKGRIERISEKPRFIF